MRSVHSVKNRCLSNKTLCLAAGTSLVLIGIILFIRNNICIQPDMLTGGILQRSFAGIVPLPVMECAKKFGLIRQRY